MIKKDGILLAHITNYNGMRIEQSLKEHCYNVAKYAANQLESSGLRQTAYLVGLLHDMGKAKQEFNRYLEKSYRGEKVIRGSVNHTFAGVIYILEHFHNKEDAWRSLTSEIIAYTIGSHHGMFDCVDFEGKSGFEHRVNKSREELCYKEVLENFWGYIVDETTIDKLFEQSKNEIKDVYRKIKTKSNGDYKWFQIGLIARMLLSALIYADHRDTAEFMGQKHAKQWDINWKQQLEFMENKLNQFEITSDMNKVRAEISRQSVEFASNKPGIYRMNVPTGAGKTLSALRYTLAHADIYKKKRIIFVIPLLSVLDQNARVIREYISEQQLIMEYHSNVINEQNESQKEELDMCELITDDWGTPIIITTMVQLLNILFSHETSVIKRMQSLSDSIIVIDEIQSLPHKTILLFNVAMNFLTQVCNVTVVLSSATQPCFEEVKWPIQYADSPEMITLTEGQRSVFSRSQIIDRTDSYGMDINECVEFIKDTLQYHRAILVICNTKDEARSIHERLSELISKDCQMFHLSTAMCQEHRVNVLGEIRQELERVQEEDRKRCLGKKVICVATQLVEAGIDFSFDGVIRILAGIDNLAQAAGRCNRSNEYSEGGKVYLVNLKNEKLSMLKEIKLSQDSTRKVLDYVKCNPQIEVTGDEATRRFYQNLFREKEIKNTIKYPVEEWKEAYLTGLLGENTYFAPENHRKYILSQPFKSAGKLFQVFDVNTMDVIVPYERGKELLAEIAALDEQWKYGGYEQYERLEEILKQTKPYTISIYQWQKKKLWELGNLDSYLEGKIWYLRDCAYDEIAYGLLIQEPPVDGFIL